MSSSSSQHSAVYRLWVLQTQRLSYLTRLGCKVEFGWNEQHACLFCLITPPDAITSSLFRGFGRTLDAALGGAYKIAMEAGVFDPMEEGA